MTRGRGVGSGQNVGPVLVSKEEKEGGKRARRKNPLQGRFHPVQNNKGAVVVGQFWNALISWRKTGVKEEADGRE